MSYREVDKIMWNRIRLALITMVIIGSVGRGTATPLQDLSKEMTALVKAAGPSVVEVKAESATGSSCPGNPTPNVGTGFVISSDGYILTKGTLVADSSNVQVTFPSGSSFDAVVTGVDTRADVAVIKINKTGLKALSLGNSATVTPGTAVVLINNQAGLTNSVSLGVISGTNRRIGSGLTDLMQISGTIGPGASGGPVFDSTGKVIAMTLAMLAPPESPGETSLQTALYPQYLEDWRKTMDIEMDMRLLSNSRSMDHPEVIARRQQWEAAQSKLYAEKAEIQRLIDSTKPATTRTSGSTGFAIPINTVKPLIEGLKYGKSARRAVLGAQLVARDGQMIIEPLPNTPAASAGLKPGDVLISVDSKSFETPTDVLHYIGNKKPGDVVTIVVRRDAKNVEAKVKLGEAVMRGSALNT